MGSFNSVNRYEDIIDQPHHVSVTRAQMPISDRAAQFSPFAALTGYEAAIKETARLTETWTELDEGSKLLLNGRLLMLKEWIQEQPLITVTYFRPDENKSGGSYVTITGNVKKLNEYEKLILMSDGMIIPIEHIYDISIL